MEDPEPRSGRHVVFGGVLLTVAAVLGFVPVRVPMGSCGSPFAPGWTETTAIDSDCTTAVENRWEVIGVMAVAGVVLLVVAVGLQLKAKRIGERGRA